MTSYGCPISSNYLIKSSNYTENKFQLTCANFKNKRPLSSPMFNQHNEFQMLQPAIRYLCCCEFIGHYTHVSQTSGENNWSEQYHTVGVSVVYTTTNIRYFWCTLMRNRSCIWTDFVSKSKQKVLWAVPERLPAITWIWWIGSFLSPEPCKISKFNIFLIGTMSFYRIARFTFRR